MNCNHMRQVLDAWLDGEIDRGTAADIEQHLAQCPACDARRQARDDLRAQVRQAAPYYRAPAALRAAVRDRVLAPPQAPAWLRPRWWHAGVLALASALAGVGVGVWWSAPTRDGLMPEQIVASHVAALRDPQRLITVASTDQHTVKPWFEGKVDFAPAVPDLAAQGYMLLGARLDHVGERQAAAVVYRIRKHVIDLYCWRAASYASTPPTLASARGFGMVTWSEGGLRYVAVSDVERDDLTRFAELVRQRIP